MLNLSEGLVKQALKDYLHLTVLSMHNIEEMFMLPYLI